MSDHRRFLLTLLTWGLVLLRGVAAQDSVEPVSKIEKFNLSTGGTGLYRPEKWGMLKVSLRNPLDRDVELLSATCFEQNPTLQYGRRLWLPAQSRLQMWHPIRMPATEKGQKSFDLRSLVVSSSGDAETVATNESGSMQFEQSFLIAADEPVTAIIIDRGQRSDPEELSADAIALALTARFGRGLKHNFTILGDALIPSSEELFDAMDQLIIASDRIRPDSAGISAIRRWVSAGGRLWIMADKVSHETLAAILGDEHHVTEVDRVDLVSIQIEPGPAATDFASFHREVEIPVPFVRLLGQDLEVLYTVNEWPAAYRKSYGNGEILVTTLGADGWVNKRRPSDPHPPAGANFQTSFVSSGPLSQLGLDYYVPRQTAQIPRELAEDQVRQLIGNSIPDRSLVLGTLAGFTILIIAGSLLLTKYGRLEWMGAVIPILAVASALVLLIAGWSSRATVPASIAMVQLVQPIPGTDHYRTSGMAGILVRDDAHPELSGFQGGWMLPDVAGMEGTTRRIVWSDLDHWKWENLPSKPGMRTAPFQTGGTAPEAMEVATRFDPQGIVGKIALPDGLEPGDAVIVTPNGRIGVDLKPDGSFTAHSDSVLGGDQFIAAHVLSDEQQRRQRLLSQMNVHSSPRFYVWTKPWSAGTSLVQDKKTVGSALVTLPLNWDQPVAGTSILVPSPLVTIREVQGPDELRPAGLYDRRTRRFLERTGPMKSWLAFQLPAGALPLETKSALITFKVQGPLRRLELSTVIDKRRRSLKVWENPVGTLQFEITDPEALKLDPKGRLLLRVDVGDQADGKQSDGTSKSTDPAAYWQFEDVSVQISGKLAAPSN